MPIDLPFTIAFAGSVVGEFADPWADPMLLYGLAWAVFGHHRPSHRGDEASVEAVPR